MKIKTKVKLPVLRMFQLGLINQFFTGFFLVFILMAASACKDKENTPAPSLTGYQQVTLVSDTAGYSAARIDTNLVNAWGIAIGATGNLWISANHKGRSVIYDRNGITQLPPVAIQHNTGAPTGVVYNTTSVFMIPANSEISKFIFAGEDGTLSGVSHWHHPVLANLRMQYL
ncbi:MAG TPA: hypothetical protein VNW99_09105 [Cytophagaceae bacterium]|jgi:hypothetical protein|nr:hypothetical protein [Cytophagaceae bacterium]